MEKINASKKCGWNETVVCGDANHGQKTEIDFSKYASGIYVVEIMSGENTFIKKVLVE